MKHPLSVLAEEAYEVFEELGFEIALGPELETEWYNFDALNVGKDHPARDMQDTFWVRPNPENNFSTLLPPSAGTFRHQNSSPDSKFVLRTHCTATTARALEQAGKEGRLPAAFISIGKTYRNEATDITHEMQFHQIDGIMAGSLEDGVSLANLKGVLSHFYKKILGDDVEVEFRPSFFPFTEPSIEVFAKVGINPATDGARWLEMMGAGMIHPQVLKNLGLDPKKVQGFAFGGGLDRIAMIKWGVPDVRLFYQGDLRLNQF